MPILLIIVYRVEIISFLFQRGEFDERATLLTASVLSFLPIMILINAASVILVRLLIVQGKLKIVAITAILTLLLKIGMNMMLIDSMGLGGLVLATVLSGTLMAVARFAIAWYVSREDSADVKSAS